MSDRFHTVVCKVENKAGVLARVAGLFARRGFNIESLAVAPTHDDAFSRITFVVDVESASLDQVVKQLDKLINVVEIRELDPQNSIEREFMMITISVAQGDRQPVFDLAEEYVAEVLDTGADDMMLSLSDTPARIEEFETKLQPYGICQIQRTGTVGMAKLEP